MVGTISTSTETTSISSDPLKQYLYKIREEHARQQEKDYSHVFRKKSRFDLLRLSCIIVGIEFAYAAETAFVSPILLQIGIDHKHMTMIWGLSPLFGFFLAPFMGSISDRCRLSFGRRRPFIILLSITILCGLFLVPHGTDLGALLGDTGAGYYKNETTLTNVNLTQFGTVEALKSAGPPREYVQMNFRYAFILTILGTILLDFSADTCQTPARAYLLDVCIPDDHATALSIFSTMAGIGGTLGYALCAIDWKLLSFVDFLGGNVKTVFTIVTIMFIICFCITITSFSEIPLPLIEKDPLLKPLSSAILKKEAEKGKTNIVFYIKENLESELKTLSNGLDGYPADLTFGSYKKVTVDHEISDINRNLNKNSLDSSEEITNEAEDDIEEKVSLAKYLKSIVIMPKSMRILCLTNLLTWMANLCYCLYFTDFVGEEVFGGKPSDDVDSSLNKIYDEGVRFGCWGLTIYSASCSIYSMFAERLIRIFTLKRFYIGGLLIYAIGMLILAIWPSKIGVLVLSTTAGIVYATLFTVPFILVAKYHASSCFKMESGENVAMTQPRGLGTDVAIVSSMLFVAQITVSLSIGTLISWLNTTAAVLYAASALSLLSAISASFVLFIN